jgi:NADH:ubiquinone oxidoreductase subunit 6 (subunit J)
MIDILMTQSGVWSPLVLVGAAIVVLIVSYIIRSTGNKKYKKGTEQTVPFFSGGRAPEANIRSENLYWGFFEAMKRYYARITRMHTGLVNDYIYAFVLLIVLVAAVLIGGLVWA